jgi:biopolymer transport protein ExbD
MAMGGTGGTHGRIAEINVTPMADVMIVLLIIFMVATPALVRPPVALPGAMNPAERKGERLEVVVQASGVISAGGVAFGSPDSFGEWISARRDGGLRQAVVIQADRGLAYRSVAPVLAACRKAGTEGVTLAAQRAVGGERP